MKRLRWVVLVLIPLVAGCDIAVGVYLATRSDSSRRAAVAPLPSINLTATDPAASEAGGNTGTFTFTRTGSTAAALDVFFTVTGSAAAPGDYAALTSPVTIPAGQTFVTLTVTPVNDGTAEGAETVVITVTAASTYTVEAPGDATVIIDDDDDNRYHVWVATLTPAEATTQRNDLNTNGGNPDGLIWTEVLPASAGTQTTSAEFIAPPGVNTIMIQASDVQVYEIDAIEVMDAGGVVVEWANGTIYETRMTNAANILNAPDSVAGLTAATPGNKAIFFTQYTQTIVRFRIHLWWPGAQASGDLVWTRVLTRGADQSAGGAAVSANGTVYASFHDDATRDIWVVRYDSAGVLAGPDLVATGITATVGSHSVAIDQIDALPANHCVYVAATVADGNIGVEKYSMSMVDTTPGAGNFFVSTNFSGVERLEANGIAVDGARNVIITGGVDSLLSGIDHWMMKFSSTGSQSWLVSPAGPGDNSDTWWHAVAADSANNYFATGDQTVAGSLDVSTQRVNSGGGASWSTSIPNAAQTDLGTAVAVDLSAPANDIVVAGYQTVGGQGRNGVMHKYTNGGGVGIAPFPITYNGAANGDDEILDLAVDASNGAIYAVGYETAAGQGTNMWIRRYSQAGAVVWTRTHHHAGFGNAGNDRAVSVSLNGPHLIVVGDVTLPAGGKEIHVRKYVK